MSYKSVILSDHPLAYYPLDDLTTTDTVLNFSDLLAQFSTYQDVLDNFSSYANMYGDIAYDYSGLNNNGNYIGDPESHILPIVVGNSRSTKITSSNSTTYTIGYDYAGNEYTDHFATQYSSDADFTLECWFYPKISSSNVVSIFADSTNNIGLFYDKGNITFKLDSKSVSCTAPNIDTVMHIVAVYSVSAAYIYINGSLETSISLTDFAFTNSQCNLQSGPAPAGDYFLLNSLAAYRYALSYSQIVSHYNEAQGLQPIQIVYPENGELFKVYDSSPSLVYKYSYPGNRSWDYFTTSDLLYDQVENSMSLKYISAGGSKTIVIDDYITLPLGVNMDSSKIEWLATPGVSISTSLDGITYTSCENGGVISGYEINNFNSSGELYIRITMSTTDASKYIPKIQNLIIAFYNNQKLYAENTESYITTLEGVSGVTAFDISYPNDYSEILWRSSKNGIKSIQNSGFIINTNNEVGTLQFFYTPSSLNDNGLINISAINGYSAANLYWHNSGTVSKTNILKIYVNGVDKTSQTNVSNIFKQGDLHHVLIVFSSLVSGQIKFGDSIYGSVPGLFQNIALYPTQFDATKAQDIYNLYIYKDYEIYNASPLSSVSMTENSVSYYNTDWLVVQTA